MRRIAFLLCFLAGHASAAEPSFPPLTARVIDRADVLSPPVEAELSEQLAAHERATSHQVVVTTIASLEGQAIEEYGVALGRAWGIGEKGTNTGTILIVAPGDRQVRIEVGYGLEGQLTDALSRMIIERDILPSFRAGPMEVGIAAGVTTMLAVLRGDEAALPQAESPAGDQDPSDLDLGDIPLVLILILFFLFVRFGRRRRRGLWPLLLGGPAIWHGGGRRSGGFGGGGFRGGGGSFGGGGASGRWRA